MAAGMLLAEGGRQVYLLDSAPAIGGSMHLLDHTFPTNSCGICLMLPHQPSLCPTLECDRHPNMTLLPYAELTGLTGEPGAFTAASAPQAALRRSGQVQRLRRVRPGVPRRPAARPRGLAGPGQGDLPPGRPAGRARRVGHRHGLPAPAAAGVSPPAPPAPSTWRCSPATRACRSAPCCSPPALPRSTPG